VIGLGNPARRDDGVGWAVAAAVGRRLGDAVELRWCDGEPARLLEAWTGADVAVVVDAMRSGAPAGTVRVITADEITVLGESAGGAGTHAVGIGHAVALGRAVGRLPHELHVVGVEAGDHGFGDGLSVPVAEAIERAIDLVIETVGRDR
jgi:hydrogenase maturation protease